MLDWLVKEKGIEPHIPVLDKSSRDDGTFSVSDFPWDEQANEYRCPQASRCAPLARVQHPRTHITPADTIVYRAAQTACNACPLKSRCCPNTPARKITRSMYEESRTSPATSPTPPPTSSREDRKKVEMLFAHLKRILKLDRLRLRGRRGARDEFLLAATAQNLRRMAKRWMQMTMIEPIRAT